VNRRDSSRAEQAVPERRARTRLIARRLRWAGEPGGRSGTDVLVAVSCAGPRALAPGSVLAGRFALLAGGDGQAILGA